MKSTIISMLIVLVVMVALPMIFLGENNFAEKFGFSGFGKQSASNPASTLPENVKPVVTDKKVEIYTWVNEQGIKQFSNTPPPQGGNSEKIVLSPDTNVIQGIKVPEEETEVAAGPKVLSVGNPYTPGGMKEVIDSASDIKETMGQRQAEQDKMLQQLFKPAE